METDGRKAFAVIALVFIVFGTITNMLTFIICCRKSLRCTPTFTFMSFIVISDTIALFGLNMDWYYYDGLFGIYLSDQNWFYCKIHFFIHFCPLKISAWLMVAMSLEGFLSVKINKWRTSLFNPAKAALVSIGFILLFSSTDSYLLLAKYFIIDPSTNETVCKSNNYVINDYFLVSFFFLFLLASKYFLLLFNFLGSTLCVLNCTIYCTYCN